MKQYQKAGLLYLFLLLFATQTSAGQISAKLMRYMDISDDQITFVYGGDIWLVDKQGGTAHQLTTSPGEESWPKFSPDGDHIAYSASYDGNEDVYVIPTDGGVPTRVTYQSHADRMVAWHPDGEHLLFASVRKSGRARYNQFYKVSRDGGLAERLPIPYGELASYSPDGNRLAYITKITENYPFKRYRGGLASDVILFDLRDNTARKITDNPATDGKPTWAGNSIYYLSDRGDDMRLNIWKYSLESRQHSRLTDFDDYDITYMSAGDEDLVFEAGGTLYVMDLETEEYEQVDVNVISDLSKEMPRTVDVSDQISNATAAPGGKRVVFEARGELFNTPVKEGFTSNMTRSSGAFDRNPAWSPDGQQVAYWSDRSGEYEIWLQPVDGSAEARRLTSRGEGFGYTLHWSPDSRKLAFIDETNTIYVVDTETGETEEAGNTQWNIGHNGRFGYPISWSPDSRWVTFTQGLENAHSAIYIYDTEKNEARQVTSGFYDDTGPVFSRDGKYLFFLTDREYDPAYSSLEDGTWVYPNATKIAAVSLTEEVDWLLHPKNDVVEQKREDEDANGEEKGDDEESDSGENQAVAIDFEGFESRLVLLPPEAGNLAGLMPFEGKLAYLRFPNTGSSGQAPSVQYYDLEERKQETIIAPVSSVSMTADGKQLLVNSQGKYGIVDPAPGQEVKEPIPTDGLEMDLVPREEWRQIFADTWRRYRDFFYDPNMHGVDWEALRERYGALIDDARTRWDISNLQSNLGAELSAGHTYTFGGDTEEVDRVETGFLGIDWEKNNDRYRVGRIVRPAPWDMQVRSPFDRSGVDVDEGDYILAVNGTPLDPDKDPYAAFEGLSGETVALTVSESAEADNTREVIVETLTQGEELELRHLEWIERNRKRVEELSNGRLGYVYMSNTAGQGQRELVRMFYGQLHKDGFVIDERFNGGGQLADRFMELLERPVVYNLHWRHGRDHTWPVKTNTGPMAMVINGWAGSGGDALPWAFQELNAGPIVGQRTLGILVGPATGHQLVDGGGITVPGARLYDNDGHWFWEGEGVTPDIEVWNDPESMINGGDPQLERAVQEVMNTLEANPDMPEMTPSPPIRERTAEELNDNRP
ncbi:MAG: PDZ domain-containing protein [Balneolaceae bacterium]|nr:PDZ domain-containing protein [Balneolaceae bacterium]